MTSSDRQDFVGSLKSARTGREAFSHEDHPGRPQTVAAGYELQRELVAALGQRIVGGKSAAGSAAAMRRYGITAPVYSPILDGMVQTTGAGEEIEIRLPAFNGLVLETEVGVRVAAGSPMSVMLLVELAHSSYANPDAVTGPDLVADLTGAFRFVCGPALSGETPDSQSWRTIGPSGPIPMFGNDDRPSPLPSAKEIKSFLQQSIDLSAPDTDLVLASGTLHAPTAVNAPCRFEFYCGTSRQFSLAIGA